MTTVAISTYVGSYLLEAPTDTLSITATGTVGSGGVVTAVDGVYSIINSGRIGDVSTGNGVLIYRGGTVINDLGGTIAGGAGNGVNIGQGYEGQGAHTSYGSVVNSGTIVGGSTTGSGLFFGYNLLQGVFVTNGGSTNTAALIAGADGIHDTSGIFASIASTITNFGTIQGTGGANYAGIKLDAGTSGTIVNGSTLDTAAVISGYVGIDGYGGRAVTVQNFGTVQGTSGVAVRLGLGAGTLIDEAGAVFLGTVDGNGGTLQLAADAGEGTLTGLGTGFADFDSIGVNAGATWTLSGANTIAAGSTFTDSGTLLTTGVLLNQGSMAVGGLLEVTGALDNAGSISALAAYAIRLLPGGYLRNEQGATIDEIGGGTRFNPTVFGAPGGTTTVVNLGTILDSAGAAALYFYGAGQITNGSTEDTTALIQAPNAIYAYWG